MAPAADSDLLETGLTAASIVLATLGWIYASWLQRKLARSAHTLDILLAHDTHGDLAELLDRVDARIGADAPPTLASFDPELKRVLNFYEFICAAARRNTLDQDLLIDTQRGRMLRLYHYSLGLIAELRAWRKNPRIMNQLEWFARARLDYARWLASDEAAAAFPARPAAGAGT